MANTYTLKGGFTDIDLVWDQTTQKNYKIRNGTSFRDGRLAVNFFVPDMGFSPKVMSVSEAPKTMVFRLSVFPGGAADWNVTLRKINAIKRLVHGPNQQALRYHQGNDGAKIYLRAQLDGSDFYVDHTVLYGMVDDGGAYYNKAAEETTTAIDVFVTLVLMPYGQGATINLNNAQENGDFYQEGSTANLAAGWTAFSGFTGYTFDTTNFLINGVAQHCTASTSGDGLEGTNVAVVASGKMAGYVWIYLISGSVEIDIYDGTVAWVSKVLTSGDGNGVADKTIEDAAGATWYRVPVSHTDTGSGGTYRLLVISNGGAAEWVMDGAYFDTANNTTTVPDGWCSDNDFRMRGDRSTTNPAYINHMDIWGIPGDGPALITHIIDPTTITNNYLYLIVGKITDGKYLAADMEFWFDTDSSSGETNFIATDFANNGSWAASTGTTNNHFWRFSDGGAGTGEGGKIVFLDDDLIRRFFAVPRRLFVAVRTSHAGTVFTVYMGNKSAASDADLGIITDQKSIQVNSINTWELHDAGALVATDFIPDAIDAPVVSGYPLIYMGVQVEMASASANADFDFMWAPWAGADSFMVIQLSSALAASATSELHIDGNQEGVISSLIGSYEQNYIGSVWSVAPGPYTTRFTYQMLGSANQITIGDLNEISFQVVPQASHMLSD